jgi:RNA polymerase sigma factor (sigma-70 family)
MLSRANPTADRYCRAGPVRHSMEPDRPPRGHVVVSIENSTSSMTLPTHSGESFVQFYRREFPRAAQLAWLLTHAGHSCEDLAQDAFISIQAKFARLDDPSAYLTAAVVNRCRTWHRREQRRRLLAARAPTSAAEGDHPADEYLLDVIGALPYKQRVVVVARYWGGWSEAEIASALGCRPGTVKSLASRALSRLRKEVEQ